MVQGFHHLAVNVTDFDAALRFYSDVLGFTARYAWGGPGKRAVMVDVGNGNYIEFFEKSKVEGSDGRLVHFALRTDDCAALLERVRTAGVEIIAETKDVDIPSSPAYPVRIAFFKGPNGETVEIFQERT